MRMRRRASRNRPPRSEIGSPLRNGMEATRSCTFPIICCDESPMPRSPPAVNDDLVFHDQRRHCQRIGFLLIRDFASHFTRPVDASSASKMRTSAHKGRISQNRRGRVDVSEAKHGGLLRGRILVHPEGRPGGCRSRRVASALRSTYMTRRR